MRMTLQPDLADLAPGDEAEFHVAMANDGSDDIEVELDLQGLDADLWTLANPIPVIPAGQVGRTTIRVRLPEDATPGERRISVSVRDAAGTVGASAAAALRVGSNDVIAIETDPASVAGTKGAKLDTIVRNRGDETLRLRVTGRSDGASVTIRPAEFDLPPGKGARLKARIERNRRSWFKERRHGLVLDVRGGTVPATTSAIFVQKPIVPPVLLRSLAVLVALAVWASATFVLFSSMSTTEEAAAPVAPAETLDPNAPPPTVLLAGDVPVEDDGTVAPPLVIAGTVEGPRDLAGTAVTIERVSFGDEGTTDGGMGKVAPLTPVAVTSGTVLDKITATTDEKGRFRVASGLAQGAFYRVTAQRAGFDLRSQVVSITEETPEIELALSLVPGRGVMTGRVVDTEGNPVGGATIAATQGSVTYRTTTASTGDAIGSWSLDGLATPFTYLITVAAVGYASQQLTVDVGGGATVGAVDAELTRDRGTIRGRITYRDAGVGAVTVALEGEVSRTTTTLTIGDLKGSFDFPNLPYGTYLLTFSAPGWLTSSREVTVSSGDVPVDVKDLLPSTAVVQGVVAQQVVDGGCDYPDPTAAGASEIGAGSCGGVGVSVIGENGVWSTTTATGDGSFRISGVPAGEYTVRFERYGYLPEFYKVVVGPGDVVTLPDDATYDVEMAAYVGPRNRVLEPLSTDSVQLRLVPTTALDAGRVTGTVRDAFHVKTPFDASFPDWSGGCRDERVDVVVLRQPDVVCALSAGGGFELLGVAAGAADMVVNAPGFGTYTTTIQVAPTGETQAGLIPLTPLASLVLNVTGTGDVPVEGAAVFVAPTDPTVPVFKGEADVRECTVARADVNDLWREVSVVPTGYESRNGLCGDADTAGDVSFARGLGTGSFEVILPVNGADPDPSVPGNLPLLAGTLPMDHRQLSRSIDVQVGENARLDLRLRRYASIVGTIQVPNPTGTGYTNLTALDGLAVFPAMGADPDDPGADEGIEFCEIYALGDTIPTGSAVGSCKPYTLSYVTPRVSFGSAAGLSPGQFRINRIPPNEGTLLRKYRIRIETDEGSFERSPAAGGGVEGLAFGEERTLSAVASPGPTDIEIDVVWDDGSGTPQPVPNAILRVTGTAGYRTIDVAPFREEIILTCPSATCEDGQETDDDFTFAFTPDAIVELTDGVAPGNRPGYGSADGIFADLDDRSTPATESTLRIDEVYRVGLLTLEVAAPGFDQRQIDVPLRSLEVSDGYELELTPAARRAEGSITFSPSAPPDVVIGALSATLTPSAGGASVSTTVSADGVGGGSYTFTSVRPGSYTLRISGSGIIPSATTQAIEVGTSSTVTLPSITVNRGVSLDVTVEECAPAVAVDCSTAAFVVVPGATVQLQSSTDNGASWTSVGTATSCSDVNSTDCAGLGVATFSGLVASSGTTYQVVIPAAPKAGYRRVEGTTGTFSVGSLSSATTPTTVRVEQFGSVTGVVRAKLASSDSDVTAPRLAGVTVQLKDGATVVGTAVTDGSGTYTFPATLRAADAVAHTIVIPATGVAAATNYQAQGTPPTVTLDGPKIQEAADIVLTASTVAVSGTVEDPTPDPAVPLANVRVSVVGGPSCDATPDPSDASDPCKWTDANGDFSILVAPRNTTLRFEEFSNSTGSWVATNRPVLERSVNPAIGQGLTGLVIEQPPALGDMTGRIQGRDYDGATPADLAGATVTATLISDPSIVIPAATTGGGGAFTFEDLGVGSYNLTIAAAGYVGETYAGVLVVANGSSTVPTITLEAATRPVKVAAKSGGVAAVGLAVTATPPVGSLGLSAVTGTTDPSGTVTVDLVPGSWTLSTTNGSSGAVTVGGTAIDHIDASAIPLSVTFSADRSLLDYSSTPSLQFVEVSGTVTGLDSGGSSTGPLANVAVTVTPGTASTTTDGDGYWRLFAPPTASARTLTFDVERIGYRAGTTSASVSLTAATAPAVALQALPGQRVTVALVSSAGSAVTGATVTVTQGSDSLSVSDDDADGSVVFPSLAAGDYVVSVRSTNGVVDGATDHLAFGPINPITGADLGTGPRTITVSADATFTVVLQKLDTALSGSVGTATDGSLSTRSGATVTAVWTSGSQSATVAMDVSSEVFSGSVASDRSWTVTVTPPDGAGLLAATRSIAAGGSGALGRVTLSSGVRTVSGAITGPAGRTVPITASANGFAEQSVSQTVAIDTGTVAGTL
ncbi:MAG: carboxypeptidase regulatory-like domain-containing protein, partial [Ilumatobacteraceae bacterium]